MSNTLSRFLIVSYPSADLHDCLGWTAGVFSFSANHLPINHVEEWRVSEELHFQTVITRLAAHHSTRGPRPRSHSHSYWIGRVFVCAPISAVTDEPEQGIASVDPWVEAICKAKMFPGRF